MEKEGSQKYGLIGKTLDHSFSKDFFTDKFERENHAARYENIELSNTDQLQEWLQENGTSFGGLNVTIPYKMEIIPFLSELSKEAKAIGAVNTISVEKHGFIGHNTDAYGFRQAIKPFLRNVHEKALILGTGGASKAIAYVLRNLGVDVAFLSRNPEGENQFSYDEANEIMVNSFLLIVNCTPVGTVPNVNEKPDFPIHFVGKDHLVIDLIYNPEETQFLKIARENKADTLNGLSMLKHQALKAWEIWNS